MFIYVLYQDIKCNTTTTCPRTYVSDYEYIGGYYGACNEYRMIEELLKNGPFPVSYLVHPHFHYYRSGIYDSSMLKDIFEPFEVIKIFLFTISLYV